MSFNLKLDTAATEYPITKEEAKTHLRFEDDEEDALIISLITAVTEHVELFLRRRLITQTWKLFLDDFPRCAAPEAWPGAIYLPYPPTQSVTWVKYYDTGGNLTTLSAGTDYLVLSDDTPARVVPAPDTIWPNTQLDRPDAVEIKFVCGYGARAAVPKGITQAMLILLTHWFENRQVALPVTLSHVPMGVENLLWAYRDFRFTP